jgi:hypothetical protein
MMIGMRFHLLQKIQSLVHANRKKEKRNKIKMAFRKYCNQKKNTGLCYDLRVFRTKTRYCRPYNPGPPPLPHVGYCQGRVLLYDMVTVQHLLSLSTRLERKTSEKNHSPARDLNPGPHEFKPGAHLTRPPYSLVSVILY